MFVGTGETMRIVAFVEAQSYLLAIQRRRQRDYLSKDKDCPCLGRAPLSRSLARTCALDKGKPPSSGKRGGIGLFVLLFASVGIKLTALGRGWHL